MEKLNKFYGFGEQKKYFQGAEEFSFQGFGEINALFSVLKGAYTPLGASILRCCRLQIMHTMCLSFIVPYHYGRFSTIP